MTFRLHGPYAPSTQMCLVFTFSFSGLFFYPARPTVGILQYAHVTCVVTLMELHATLSWRSLLHQKLMNAAASIVELKRRAAQGRGFHRRRQYRPVHHVEWL